MRQPKITRIMIQKNPRLDALAAVWLLQNTEAGEKRYPGVGEAQIEFWDTGTMSPDGKTWQEYLKEGTLLIGVGGGPFDEHPSKDFGDRKAKKLSATMLVAIDLGLEKHQLFKQLVAMVTQNDQNPVDHKDALSNIVKIMHRTVDDPRKVMAFASEAIDAIVASQAQFIEATEEFRAKATVKTITAPDGTRCQIGFIESDNPQISAAARYRNNDLAALVQRRESGRVAIFGNQHGLGVKMHRIVGAIRRAELIAHDCRQKAIDHANILEEPGQLALVRNWCSQEPGGNMLNGSETAPNLEPTWLRDEEIMHVVCDNIDFEEGGVIDSSNMRRLKREKKEEKQEEAKATT